MSGKVVQLHQVMEHEALSIETDFSYLKDTELKAFLSTGESLSNLRTALTRGEKLLLLDKPRAAMFIIDFPKAELSTEDRVKIILHSLKPMQVRQVNPAINTAYPKDVIKAIDNRLGTAGGVMVGGNPYKSPSSDNLHPALPMKPLTKEPLVPDPKPEPTGPDKFAKFYEPAYGKKVFAKSIVLGKHVSDMRTEVESAKNFGVLSLFSLDTHPISPKTAYQDQTLLLKRADTRETDRGIWSFSGVAVLRFTPYTQLFAMWAKDTGGAQYESFDFPVMVEATTRVRFYYQLPTEQELKNDETLDKNKPILKAIHTNERQVYPDKVKVIQAVMDGEGIRAELTDELSLHWQPPTASNDVSANTAPQSNDNASTLSEAVNNALWDLKVHPQTEDNSSDILEPNLEVIVNFPAELKIKAVYLALHTGEDDEMDKKWLTVPKGKLTFDSEGNDIDDNIDFTRIIHLPLVGKVSTSQTVNGASGITIGRGLDVGSRKEKEIQDIFDNVAKNCRPVSPELLDFLKSSAGMKGAANKTGEGLTGSEKAEHIAKAKKNDKDLIAYFRNFKNVIDKDKITLTRKQQYFIFLEIYPFYVSETKRLLTKYDVTQAYKKHGILNYDALSEKVKELLIDLTYRGDNTPITRKEIMPALIKDQRENLTGEMSYLYKLITDKVYWINRGVDLNRRTRRSDTLI